MTQDREAIARLNDVLRTTLQGGRIVATQGVLQLTPRAKTQILAQLRTFNNFSPDNDPYGEHDFGALDVDGQKVFWKIDYYDPSLTRGSPDPADPALTTRVLTIMLAEEY
jgi:hypothetical protein